MGVLNPTLNVDTRLFIDPLLLEASGHLEMSGDGREAYIQHFKTAISLLQKVKVTDSTDVAWRNVRRLLSFPEIKGTCLGYGAESISGSGSGDAMTGQVLATAKAIVDLGVQGPDLFVALALFEDNFGPDRISDMTTNIIGGALLKFNERVLGALSVPTEEFNVRLKNGAVHKARLPRNPFATGVPVILVPTDILRDLPIATDWSDISDAAARNAEIREGVNKDIATLWRSKTLKDKGAVKHWALSSKKAFEKLLQSMHEVDRSPYDVNGDPKGELSWRQVIVDLAERQPFKIEKPQKLNLQGITSVVDQILKQFQFLIEERPLSEELHHQGTPRPEKAAQRLFFCRRVFLLQSEQSRYHT